MLNNLEQNGVSFLYYFSIFCIYKKYEMEIDLICSCIIVPEVYIFREFQKK